jgi:hypothetical protein
MGGYKLNKPFSYLIDVREDLNKLFNEGVEVGCILNEPSGNLVEPLSNPPNTGHKQKRNG